MKKHELLAPAGNMECLYQAVYHGADAIYIAGYQFGARKFATNFSKEELIEAIEFCHLYGVKLFVTMNTLVKENEVDAFLEQARFLHQNGVDALIVQDFGMICLLREKFPNLEIHASTQFNNSSKETCSLLEKLGVKRVVFSRELSIDEIDSVSTSMEKEAFIHGALCISYSGRCFMSSMLGGRSGNRGECAGCCRMKYSLYHNKKQEKQEQYLLSTKELNTTSNMKRLLESSIYSFKIEGRMKSPLYVAFITDLYRKLIDQEKIDLEEEIKKLKIIFNREFTVGRIFQANDIELMNPISPNHVGLRIGTAEPTKDKIKIVLDKGEKLYQNDAIRFQKEQLGMMVNYLYDSKLKLCKESDNICYVDNKVGLTKKDILSKTQSTILEKEYLLKESKRKVPITFSVTAKKNSPLTITITDLNNTLTATGNIIEEAKSMPTTKETIQEKLSKIHDTPFKIEDIKIDMDKNIFVQIKQINDLKRKLISKLIDIRKHAKSDFVENDISIQKEEETKQESSYTCSILTEEQLQTCLNYPFKRIYVADQELYEKYKDLEKVYFVTEKCAFDYSKEWKEKNLVNDLLDYHNQNSYGGYQLNITNSYSAYYTKKLGLKNIPLSCELKEEEIENLIRHYQQKVGNSEFEIFAYGRVENMIIKGNILQIEKNDYSYELVDVKNRHFPVYFDGRKTHILNDQKINILKENKGIITKRIDFYEETIEEINSMLKTLFS